MASGQWLIFDTVAATFTEPLLIILSQLCRSVEFWIKPSYTPTWQSGIWLAWWWWWEKTAKLRCTTFIMPFLINKYRYNTQSTTPFLHTVHIYNTKGTLSLQLLYMEIHLSAACLISISHIYCNILKKCNTRSLNRSSNIEQIIFSVKCNLKNDEIKLQSYITQYNHHIYYRKINYVWGNASIVTVTLTCQTCVL